MTDRSTEALLARRALDQEATPEFIRKGLSIYGPKHPQSKHPNGRILVSLVTEGSNRLDSNLNGGAGIGSGDADAADIDEILRLRAENEKLKQD